MQNTSNRKFFFIWLLMGTSVAKMLYGSFEVCDVVFGQNGFFVLQILGTKNFLVKKKLNSEIDNLTKLD